MKKSTKHFKHILMLVAFVCLALITNAQTVGVLYGMTPKGGDSLGGVLYNYDPISTANNVAYTFQNIGPEYPYYNNVIQANDGNYYGMTTSGGGNGYGEIFKYNPSTQKVTTLVNFDYYNNGGEPTGSLIQATDGNLYGMTSASQSGFGTLFKCTLGGTLTTLVAFNDTNGGTPYGSLIQGTDGKLYGMTNVGGAIGSGNYGYGFGTIFVCTLAGTISTLVNFDSTNMGCYPIGSLIQAIDGNLYGMTSQGGTADSGTLFKCTTNGTFTLLADFNYKKGAMPYGSLVQATSGNLYGMTQMGGTNGMGTLFKCTTTGLFTVLDNFAGNEYPLGSLIQATDGNLYGMTTGGGAHNAGYVLKCSLGGSITDIFDFNILDGKYPYSSLYQGSDGELYGMTSQGGTVNNGTFFKCSTAGTQVVLDNFGSLINGDLPYGNVIQATDGMLYGMTEYGGAKNLGTIFQYNPVTASFKTLYSFDSTHGATPMGTLMQASDGKLYGTTSDGGRWNYGMLFSCTTAGVLDTLKSFNQATMGSFPTGALIQAKDGNLYGTAEQGGSSSDGTVFKYTLAGVFTKIADFTGPNGAYPRAGLIQATDGNLYGLANSGGATGYGDIFKCTTSGTLTYLTDCSSPTGTVIQASDGNLYGINALGNGQVFKCTLAGAFTIIANLNGSTTGVTAEGSMMQASDGNLYFTAYGGGTTGYGVVLQCSLTGTLNPVVNFNVANGYGPNNDLTEIMSVNVTASDAGCTTQTITANVRGGGTVVPYTYLWSTGATTSSISGETSAGTYSVTVRNSKGITINASINLPAFTAISATATGTNENCMGDSTAAASVIISGGSAPYAYAWNSGQTTASISNLKAGKYVATVTDNSGCVTKDSVTVTQPTKLTAAITGINDKCYGASMGSVTATVAGGTSPYAYSWSNGKSGGTITNLSAGDYSVTVTDKNGCTVMDYDTIKQPANTLPMVHICMVTVDTASKHNVIIWDKTGITGIDSIKVYYYNSSNKWTFVGGQLFSGPNYWVDTASINNPNMNTVRYCLIGTDSCGNDEAFAVSPWQNTTHIINTGGGTFLWSGTGYLIEGDTLPVLTYVLMRDNVSNGNWLAIDSVSGTQNTMTDPNYSLYPKARWRVDGRLDSSVICSEPVLRPYKAKTFNSSHSNTANITITGIAQTSQVNSISAYPNPASDVLNIKFGYIKSGNAVITLTDITGRTIQETNTNISATMVYPVNIANLPAGVYFVKVNSNSFSQVIKFIKE